MKLKLYGLWCVIVTGCYADVATNCSASVDTQDQHTFNIHIHQNITQDVDITNENNNNTGSTNRRCKCCDYFGTKLIECMKSIPAENVKDNFIQLTPKSACSVLNAFDAQQTTELVAYFTKEEWHDWHEKLPQDIQGKIGSTRENAIRSAKRRELCKDLVDIIKGLLLL
ncbi:MAG: hypothetical protein M1114_05885 [Candidatus Dependentiae bacterium]|nr:hypothetical protein [Candidatus Dependentiae bacterium]